MNSTGQVIVIDAGNTSIKVGVFVNDSLKSVHRFSIKNLNEITAFKANYKNAVFVLSSVLSDEDTNNLLSKHEEVFVIHGALSFPFQLNYETPNSLGMDRLGNAAFLFNQESQTNISIDIGTCVKFDVVNKTEGYIGGSISPGIQLRYNALNDYTGKLPLLHNKNALELVGRNTEQSLRSGVMNGQRAEIQGFIDEYESLYNDLTFFVTGGDASFFDFHSKKHIFADENLTLKGLYEIYKHNS